MYMNTNMYKVMKISELPYSWLSYNTMEKLKIPRTQGVTNINLLFPFFLPPSHQAKCTVRGIGEK